jgi:hypothetical protein
MSIFIFYISNLLCIYIYTYIHVRVSWWIPKMSPTPNERLSNQVPDSRAPEDIFVFFIAENWMVMFTQKVSSTKIQLIKMWI